VRGSELHNKVVVDALEKQLRHLGWKETARRWFDQDIKLAALTRENKLLKDGLMDLERGLAIARDNKISCERIEE
jgi:hypothetical protein